MWSVKSRWGSGEEAELDGVRWGEEGESSQMVAGMLSGETLCSVVPHVLNSSDEG